MNRSKFHKRLIVGSIVAALAASLLTATSAPAQILGGRLGQRLRQPPAEEPIAVAGTPLGVGRMSVPLPPAAGGGLMDERTLVLTEKNGRALYCTMANRPVLAALQGVLNRPQMATVYFLFQGDEPLNLTLFTPAANPRQVVPQQNAAAHAQLLADWWREYTANVERANKSDEYPHVVDVYVTSMLARRLSLTPPNFTLGVFGPKLPSADETFGLALGTEHSRLVVARQTMLSVAPPTAADQPLPPPVQIQLPNFPEAIGEIPLEPLALHVPEECLYVRFGSFSNYQWFRHTLDDYGGDLRNLIALRGLNYGINARIERQISLHETPLSKLLGPAVIADVALIGDDPFMREGAAMGMLFQARNNAALGSDFTRQRAETLANELGCTEQKLQIAGHEVSLLSTPDNRVRSFYAVDGDFHLVTTSRRIVERFYEVSGGHGSLGEARDFRDARAARQPDGDQVFAFLSAAFFRQLAGPHYQIEMTRRLRSTTDIELVEMARCAARTEGKPYDTVEQLIAGQFLPAGFDYRPDGSRVVLSAEHAPTDSLRGARGTFLPIPDMEVTRVTATEAAAYAKFAESLADHWGKMGPLWAAVRRTEVPGMPGREHVSLTLRMTPLANKADMLSQILGPPDGKHIVPTPGDVIAIDAVVSGHLLAMVQPNGGGGGSGPYHLFGALRGGEMPVAPSGLIPLQLLSVFKFYIGGWPTPGAVGLLSAGLPSVTLNANGGPLTVVSPQQDVLAAVSQGLKVVPAENAQLFVHVGDVRTSQLAQMANSFGYGRARQISQGNVHFLQSLVTQLGVQPQQALLTAEQLADARLVSPVKGGFELQSREGEFPTWTATGLKSEARSGLFATPPAGFQTPPLDWLRGLELRMLREPGKQLSVNAEVDMQRPTP